jgi:legume-like lectin family protein
MLSLRMFAVCVLALVMALCCVPAVAQISSLNFAALQLNGTATGVPSGNPQVLQLTVDGTQQQAGSAWYMTPQSVANGFTTVFQFQITHNPSNGNGPADGFAFVIQNSTNFGEAGPLFALGGPGGDIGYGSVPGDGATPIDNSVAIEFDTYQNGWDPNANHVAVQSCGSGNNTPDHTATCPSGQSSNLGITTMPGNVTLADGNVHTVILQYDPGTLSIFIDNSGTPVLTVPVQIGNLLNLSGGAAYVGFTGATGASAETNDILSWTFTPGGNSPPTTITQTLIPGPGQHFTNYVFGSYNHKYGYSGAQAGDTVSVTAIPSSPSTVNPTLASFAPNASCIVYDGTGGDCVVFQVSCSQQTGNDCTNLPYTLFESYNTNQNINYPCLLKTEAYNPPQPSVWTNIETAFSQTRFDPTSSGGSRGFSYFVAAQNCESPASRLNGWNCNGVYTGTYHGTLLVFDGQSCTFTNGGVTGDLLQFGGMVVLESSSFVNGNLLSYGGGLWISNSTVGNGLEVIGDGSYSIGPAASIGGDLQILGPCSSSGTNQVCGASVSHNLLLQNSGAAAQIGSATGCAGNTVGGNLQVLNNSGATTIDSNTVGGNLLDQNNLGATQVFTNTITHNLQCSGNSSITGGGNTAAHKLGQCATF